VGAPTAARAFAEAAVRAVDSAFDDYNDDDTAMASAVELDAARSAAEAALWRDLFDASLLAGATDDAYVALLSSPAPLALAEGIPRLVSAAAADSAAGARQLARLPFAGVATTTASKSKSKSNALLLLSPTAEEAAKALRRRADASEVSISACSSSGAPNPYQLAYAAAAARGDWRRAAGAQLALARRLRGTGSGSGSGSGGGGGGAESAARAKAKAAALRAAANALRLVPSDAATLEDPWPLGDAMS